MPNYQLGKIYSIRTHLNPDEFYIGSTAQEYLSQRYAEHIRKYKKKGSNKCNSKLLFDKYGIDNCYIELIENYPCNSKDELRMREGFYQRQYIGKGSINKRIEGRTDKEYREDNKEKIAEYKKVYYETKKEQLAEYRKEYYEDNKEKIAGYKKVYYETNKEQIAEYNKEYYEKNKEKNKEYREKHKEKILEQSKEYREKNKDKINEKVICECGCEILKRGLQKHKKTHKHIELLKTKDI